MEEYLLTCFLWTFYEHEEFKNDFMIYIEYSMKSIILANTW